jgi:uncharacterized membrane protein
MSEVHPDGDLEARVARLERVVAELVDRSPRRESPAWDSAGEGTPVDTPTLEEPPGSPRGPDPRNGLGTGLDATGPRWDTDKLLGRAGILFVVLAFAFLLKLSFDRGWITPALRLVAGTGAGVGLLIAGLRLEAARRRLAQALLAGSIALFYLVTYAGSQFYGYFPPALALAFMSTVTLLAFVLAERQDSPALAVMALVGGLATPWLLLVEPGDGVAIYLTLVLLGGGGVYVHRGWPALLMTLVVGGWLSVASHTFLLPGYGIATLGLVGTFWLVTAAFPLLRPVLKAWWSDESPVLLLRSAAAWGSGTAVLMLVHLLSLGRLGAGFLFLGLAVIFACLWLLVRRSPSSGSTSAEGSALALAAGVGMVSWGMTTPLLLAVEVVALLAFRERIGARALESIGHAIGAVAAAVFLSQSLAGGGGGYLGFHQGAVPHLGFLAMVVLAGSWAGRRASVYRSAAYVGLLVWLFADLAPRPEGPALVSIAWAVQGVGALVTSRVRRSHAAQAAGLGTLGLVAAKLLLVDLSQLDPVWRILLFLGFGATLLGLGYWLNAEGPGEGQPDSGSP